VGSLAIGVVLDALGRDVYATEGPAFYVTVVLCFVATLVYRPFVGRIRRPAMFAAINVATDLALVTALVLFSGGKDSVFTFLYVAVGLYGAVLFPGWGALGAAVAGSLAYGVVLWVGRLGWLGAISDPLPVMLTSWLVHVSAMLGVAGLAGFLTRELVRAGIALEERSQDLAQLRSLHEWTVESLQSGLLTTDLDGSVTSFNREAERITHLSRGEALGWDLEAVLPGVRAFRARRRSRMPDEGPDGRIHYLGIGCYELRDAAGATEGEVVIFQDVTDVVAMEEELRLAERLAAIGGLSASIAHEIRNPLAAISGSIQMMRSAAETGDGESRRLMDIVLREVDRLDRLIADFLQFARPAPPRVEVVGVAELLGEVLEMFDASRPEGVRTECELEPGLRVAADPAQLRQVLWNLLQNAVQAMPDGGLVRFEGRACAQEEPAGDRMVEKKPVRAEIAVMDQGPGIPADVVEHAFDPFFTTKPGGTGLGLAIVQRVLAEHGGVVRLENGVGRFGTVVRLSLPVGEAAGDGVGGPS
jgi:two-component system sensor histidine kinase PilS (NtrC family)